VPYIIGPTVEVRLKGLFSLDVEALYSRVDYDHTAGVYFIAGSVAPIILTSFTATKHIVDRWEFPVLLKYKINTRHRLRPFIEAGISTQRSRERETEGLAGFATQGIFGPPSVSLMRSGSSVVNRSVVEGATFGIGASFGVRRVRPSMELRYTRWFDKAFTVGSPFSIPGSSAPHTAYSVLNQAQIMVGVMF
jgi:hypothetical protein